MYNCGFPSLVHNSSPSFQSYTYNNTGFIPIDFAAGYRIIQGLNRLFGVSISYFYGPPFIQLRVDLKAATNDQQGNTPSPRYRRPSLLRGNNHTLPPQWSPRYSRRSDATQQAPPNDRPGGQTPYFSKPAFTTERSAYQRYLASRTLIFSESEKKRLTAPQPLLNIALHALALKRGAFRATTQYRSTPQGQYPKRQLSYIKPQEKQLLKTRCPIKSNRACSAKLMLAPK